MQNTDGDRLLLVRLRLAGLSCRQISQLPFVGRCERLGARQTPASRASFQPFARRLRTTTVRGALSAKQLQQRGADECRVFCRGARGDGSERARRRALGGCGNLSYFSLY